MAKEEIRDYFDSYTQGTMTTIIQELGINRPALVKLLQDNNVVPLFKFRKKGGRGRSSDVYDLDQLRPLVDTWKSHKSTSAVGVAPTITNPDTECSRTSFVERFGEELDVTLNQLATMLQNSVEPLYKLPSATGRGRGTSVYNIEELKELVKTYRQEKAEKYKSTYDQEIEVDTSDIAQLLAEQNIAEKLVSPLINTFGIEPCGSYRPGERGVRKLYNKESVVSAIELVMRFRADRAD